MPDLRSIQGSFYNELMNTLAYILALLLSPILVQAQDLEALLNPSLMLLQQKVSVDSPMSCFDYPVQLPKVIKTKRTECSQPFKAIPVGKYIQMHRDGYTSGDYMLSRTGEKTYQAILNLKFVPDTAPYSGRKGDQTLADLMLNRTRNCLSEMKPYLRGPNGEELEVIITTEKETLPFGMVKTGESPIKVSYQDSLFRGDAGNFGSSFDCTTIGHEILHHLGLCDEYHEGVISKPEGNLNWGCRPVTARNSYMRNMNYAFQTTLPLTSRCECDSKCQKIMKTGGKAKSIYLSMNGHEIMGTETSILSKNNAHNPMREICKSSGTQAVETKDVPEKAFTFDSQSGNVYKFSSYRVFAGDNIYYDKISYTCECKPHQIYCHKLLGEMKKIAQQVPPRATCPDGVKPKSTGPSIGYDKLGSRVDCPENGQCDLVISTRGSGKSLLLPNQFSKIMAGNCAGGSPQYEKCEKFAYMPDDHPECSKIPAECNDDNFYLGSDQ